MHNHFNEDKDTLVARGGLKRLKRIEKKVRGRAYLCLAVWLLGLFLPVSAQAAVFRDISYSWAKGQIQHLAALNLVEGYRGYFEPDRFLTRAELAKILIEINGRGKEVQSLQNVWGVFRDLSPKHWANGYILLAQEQGWVKGYTDGTFRPDQPVTRLELAYILSRMQPSDQEVPWWNLSFRDLGKIPEEALGVVANGVSKGWLQGYPDGTFRPHNKLTRAEAASVVYRFLADTGGLYDLVGTVTAYYPGESVTLKAGNKEVTLRLAPEALLPGGALYSGWYGGLVLDQQGRVLLAGPLQGVSAEVAVQRNNSSSSALTRDNDLYRLFNGQQEPSQAAPDPAVSLNITRREMGVDELLNLTGGATGLGETIAIIDTGVDAAHPDLQANIQGWPKIVDWRDVTEDGLVNLKELPADQGNVILDGQTLGVNSAWSKSGLWRGGWWQENGIDLDFNGTGDDRWPVLVADSNKKGIYDTVWIDTNHNGDFRDETPLKVFASNRSVLKLGQGEKKRGVVLAELASDGSSLRLGFDGSGHGTHVAGIAAASGQVNGVAPGARLLVIKAVDSRGRSDTSKLAQAINLAARLGAKIVNLSIGIQSENGRSSINRLLKNLSDQYGIIFVVAAGNNGPGLSTITMPADTAGVISVGAYISPAMWLQDYGYKVNSDTLWFFSSRGPRKDGLALPTVVAPGSAVSTIPGGGYELSEGTSMAAPHVAGAIAVLRQGAKAKGLPATPELIRRALIRGAVPINGYSEVEQGAGKVNLVKSWLVLKQLQTPPPMLLSINGYDFESLAGLYGREFRPLVLDLKITNIDSQNWQMRFESNISGTIMSQNYLLLPSLTSRTLPLHFNLPAEPGLYTYHLQGYAGPNPEPAVDLLTTYISPEKWQTDGTIKRWQKEDNAQAGQSKRYFLRVEEGSSKLRIRLQVEGGQGRTRLHLFDPQGREVDPDLTAFAGVNPDGQNRLEVSKEVLNPQAGTWEVVAYTSATLANYQLTESKYSLQAVLERSTVTSKPEGELLVTVFRAEQGTMVAVRWPDGRPYNGMILIDSDLLQVTSGRVYLWPRQTLNPGY